MIRTMAQRYLQRSMSGTDQHDVSQPRSLQHNVAWTAVGNIVYAVSQWGMLMVLAKFGTPTMVGQFALGLAVTAPIMLCANLQLRTLQATDVSRVYTFGDYLGLRLITTVLALLVIVGIVLLAQYRWETALVVLAIGVAKALEAISDVLYGLLQRHEQLDRMAMSMMIKGPASLAALAVVVYFTHSVVWATVGMVAVWAMTLIGYDLRSGIAVLNNQQPAIDVIHANRHNGKPSPVGEPPVMEHIRPRWHIYTLQQLTRLALPLGIVACLISLNPNIPRYVIARQFGETELGVFAAMAYVMVAGNTVVSALAQAASPRLARHYAAGQYRAFRTLLVKLLAIGAGLGGIGILAAALAGRTILTLLYQAEYAHYASVFVWLMVSAGIAYVASLLNYSMIAARCVVAQLPLFAIVVSATTIGSAWLVPRYGLIGGAWALVLSFSVQAVGAWLLTIRVTNRSAHLSTSVHKGEEPCC